MDADQEARRLERLHELSILDSPEDRMFRGLAEQALTLFPGASIAAVSLIDTDRQWFKTIVGLNTKETPRSQSFCSHTIEAPKLMVVEDATRDSRFQDNPLVTAGPGIRFYAGVKLMKGVGALCVIGRTPRQATESELVKLQKLASLVDIQLMAHGTLSALG
ncbi:GAF domain-containing protein [Rhizobium sp. NFR03]|uniref:GAF domain-containing protein n=1 Tax=Rhizobium sp. NFR03 TaxID=1566263 RepID=UPI0008D224E4|nr:GAF domain-containing protein [Rhizobium sp. NFR03]SES28769.1 GAF domain-containing protein [Rhizobium sp. NFR03]